MCFIIIFKKFIEHIEACLDIIVSGDSSFPDYHQVIAWTIAELLLEGREGLVN